MNTMHEETLELNFALYNHQQINNFVFITVRFKVIFFYEKGKKRNEKYERHICMLKIDCHM